METKGKGERGVGGKERIKGRREGQKAESELGGMKLEKIRGDRRVNRG